MLCFDDSGRSEPDHQRPAEHAFPDRRTLAGGLCSWCDELPEDGQLRDDGRADADEGGFAAQRRSGGRGRRRRVCGIGRVGRVGRVVRDGDEGAAASRFGDHRRPRFRKGCARRIPSRHSSS